MPAHRQLSGRPAARARGLGRPWTIAAGALSALAVAAIGAGLAASPAVVGAAVAPPPAPSTRSGPEQCSRPAPTTAEGYAAMFGALDPREWGGGDTAISVALSGRSVWLFGDTLSAGRFVHSTVVVQRGGCLRVSRAGAQLLPDEHVPAQPTPSNPARIFWVQSARATGPATLAVTARAIDVVGRGPWDFRDAGYSRTALVTVDERGDATFRRWLTSTPGPAPRPAPLIDCEAPAPPRPHHVCYGRVEHDELRLTGGRPLVTVSQNWDDGVIRPFAQYQPLFRAG